MVWLRESFGDGGEGRGKGGFGLFGEIGDGSGSVLLGMGGVVGEGRREGWRNCKRQCCCSWCTESKFCGMDQVGKIHSAFLSACAIRLSRARSPFRTLSRNHVIQPRALIRLHRVFSLLKLPHASPPTPLAPPRSRPPPRRPSLRS